MHLSRQSIAMFAIVSLTSVLAQGQVTITAQHRNPGPPIVYADQEQILNYWTSEGGWHSELQLRNNLPDQELTVTPVIRSSDGEETSLPSVTIKSQEVRSINLSNAIDTNAPHLSGRYGSVALRYHAADSRNLYAAMMVHDTGHPIAFHIDASGESSQYDSGSREGIWWLPSDATKDILILTNQGKQRMEVDLTIYDARGKETHQRLPLGPRQTARYSIRQFIRAGGLTGEFGGIHIQALTHGGSLDTLHAVYDEDAGFSALLKMFDRDPQAEIEERDFNHTATWTLRAPMLALANPDPALGFPVDTVLKPQIFIRNTTAKRITANLRFNWRNSQSTGSAKGPTIALAPLETRRIDISQIQNVGSLPRDANWAAVTVTTNSQPDEVLAVAASFDQTLRYGAQTPFSDQLSKKWKGGQWEFDSMHDSLITAGNGGSKPLRAAFTIFYNQGQEKYQLEQELEPDEQMWIDIGKLIRNQIPDKTGKLLPPDLTKGSYEFRDLTPSGIGMLYEGKVIYDKSYGHVAYGCATCCATRDVYLMYNPFYNPVGLGFTNGVYENDNCGDIREDDSGDFFNWNTANHAIATTTSIGKHTGISIGSTTSSTSGYVTRPYGRNGCQQAVATPSGPTDVVQVSQSPSAISMSNGDTNYSITVSVSPSSYASSTGMSYGLSSNPNSSSNATLSFTAPTNFTGNDAWKVKISGSNSPSGIFSDTACSVGVCSSHSTTITVPPQLLIQMFYGEANTYSAATMEALGSSVLNRFGSAHAYFASFTTWQNALICSQYNGICAASGITTGVQPELSAAVPVFNTSVGDIVGGSACFFSPTSAGWATIQQMLDSGTTTLTPVAYDPGCFSASTRQYVYKDSIDDTAGGIPTFVFVRQRAATAPAVVDIP